MLARSLLLASFSLLLGSSALAQDMYITSCSLGCTSSGPTGQIFCSIVDIHENEIIEINFSEPIDPTTLGVGSLRLVDVSNGTSPTMDLRVSPADPRRLLIEPATTFSTAAGLGFTLGRNRTYELFVPGVSQGDSGPFIRSTSGSPVLGRLQCAVLASEGVLPLARPECTTTANSVGAGATLSATGTTSVVLNDLEIQVAGLPPVSFGILVVGLGQGFSPLGVGSLCIGSQLTRQGVTQSSAAGAASWPIDLNGFGSGLVITAGSTWRFQHVYRDVLQGAAVFTTSNALRATFF